MDAKEILDTMLGHLGFVAEIQEIETENGIQLQVFTAEGDAAAVLQVGRGGCPDDRGPGSAEVS